MRTASVSNPGTALRDYELAELARAIDCLGMRGTRVHFGVHQARKSIQRARAVLALGEAALGPGATLIDRELRRANRRLSPLRDSHALAQTLERLGAKARDEASATLLDRAHRIACRQRAELARQPEFQLALQHERAMLATLHAAANGLPWASLPAVAAIQSMAASVRKADASRQRALATDDEESWHRWRRRMRRIRQQRRAATNAGIDAPAVRFDEKLTDQLGSMQDLRLLAAHCGKGSPFPEHRLALRDFAERALARQRKRIRAADASA